MIIMARIGTVQIEKASGGTKALLEMVKTKMGVVTNMIKTLANSGASLNAYLGFIAALNGGSLSTRLTEQISLAVAWENGSDYCNAVHTYIARKIGLNAQEIEESRQGDGEEKMRAALTFAKEIISTKGHVSVEALNKIRNAGYDEGEIIEIASRVSLNIFTNYINMLAETDIDFPRQKPLGFFTPAGDDI